MSARQPIRCSMPVCGGRGRGGQRALGSSASYRLWAMVACCLGRPGSSVMGPHGPSGQRRRDLLFRPRWADSISASCSWLGGWEGQPRGQNGPPWWAEEEGSGNRGLSGVQYTGSEAALGPGQMWVPRGSLEAPASLGRKTQTEPGPRCRVSLELGVWKWASRAEGGRRGQAVDEAWLRPEAEAEGGTADDSLFLWGWGLLIEGWAGADAGVRSEEVDLGPALRVGRARRQPGRAAPGIVCRRRPRGLGSCGCAKHPEVRQSLVHRGPPKVRASLRGRACGDRARTGAPSSAHRNVSLWVGETCT